jgi:hypothetical protein
MLWVGGTQGAGKSTLCWHLSRASDLPLHPVDLWSYDHQARLPAGDTLDGQLARGPEAAADAFEAVSQLRLGLLLDDIQSRDLGTVPTIVEGPQLMPGFAGRLSPRWGVGWRAQPTAPVRERGSRAPGQAVDGGRRAHRRSLLPVRVRMRDERVPRYLDGDARRLRG